MERGVGLGGLVAEEVSLRYTLGVKLLDPVPRPFAELVDRPELDRVRRAGLGTGRDEAVLLAVVAERALVRMAIEVAARDDPERAGCDAIRAAVANVALDVDVRELVIDDGARRARVLARGRHAVLADVAHHQPAIGPAPVQQLVESHFLARCSGVGEIGVSGPSIRGELLDEFHMSPGRSGELDRVIVAVAGPV